jgi:hypothetical protein
MNIFRKRISGFLIISMLLVIFFIRNIKINTLEVRIMDYFVIFVLAYVIMYFKELCIFFSEYIIFLMLFITLITINYFNDLAQIHLSVKTTYELILNILMVFIGINSFKYSNTIKLFDILSLYSIFYLVYFMSFELSSLAYIRRIGAVDQQFITSTSVNHIAHSFSIIFIYSVLRLSDVTQMRIKIFYTCSATASFVSCFATLSRAAMISLAVFIILHVFTSRNTIFNLILKFFIITGMLFAVISYIAFQGIISNSRFALNFLMESITTRLYLYLKALEDSNSFFKLFFGQGAYAYQPVNPGNSAIMYPHNFFISLLSHFGLIITLMVFIVIVSVLIKLLIESKKRFGRLTPLNKKLYFWVNFVLYSFVPVLLYINSAGRITRVLTITYLLGLGIAVLKKLRIERIQI